MESTGTISSAAHHSHQIGIECDAYLPHVKFPVPKKQWWEDIDKDLIDFKCRKNKHFHPKSWSQFTIQKRRDGFSLFS